MCNHNSCFGEGQDGLLTDGWDGLCHSCGRSDLLADGMEITESFLFQWRSRWTSHGASESQSIERIMITRYDRQVVFISVFEAKAYRQTLIRWSRIYGREERYRKLKIELDVAEIYFSGNHIWYKKDAGSSRQLDGGSGHVHGRAGVGTGRNSGSGSGGVGQERGGGFQQRRHAVVVSRGVVIEGEEILKALDLLDGGCGGESDGSQVMPVYGDRLQEPVLLEKHALLPDMLIVSGLEPGDLDPEAGHLFLIDKLGREKAVVWGEFVGGVKTEKAGRLNGLMKEMYKWIYRMRMGELGFLVRRQALAASETGNTKLNFLAKMTTAFCMVSSIPFLGVRPRPLNITTLERSFYLGTSDIYKVILPKSFLTLQIQESVLTVLLVGVHLLVEVVMCLGEGVDLLLKVLKGRHGSRRKAFLDLHDSRGEEWSHSLRGRLTDQYLCREMSLVGGGTRVKGRLSGKRRGGRGLDGWMKFYIICICFILL